MRLSPQAPRVVRSGDLIRVGRIWLELTTAQVLPTQNQGLLTKEIALALVASSLAAEGELSAPRLFVSAGPDVGKELLLAEFDRVYSIGRAPNADLVLTDDDASRRHVEVTRRGTQIFVRDLGSKNGALLSDVRLDPKRDTPWPAHASLALGSSQFGFEDPVLAALTEIEAGRDEQMQAGDAIDPPNAGPAESATEALAPTHAFGPADAAPLAEVPRRAAKTAAKAQGLSRGRRRGGSARADRDWPQHPRPDLAVSLELTPRDLLSVSCGTLASAAQAGVCREADRTDRARPSKSRTNRWVALSRR